VTDTYNSGIVYRQAFRRFLCAVITNVFMKVSVLKLDLNETDAASTAFGTDDLHKIYNEFELTFINQTKPFAYKNFYNQ